MSTGSLLGLAAVVAAAGCERSPAPPLPTPAAPAVTPEVTPEPIVGWAGPEELLPDEGWMPLAGVRPAAYRAAQNPSAPAPRVLPPALPVDAQLGVVWLGGDVQATWLLAGDAARGYTFTVDANLDGDLTDDPVVALARSPAGDWVGEWFARVPDRALAVLHPVHGRIVMHAGELALLFTTQRRGTIEVAGRPVAFTLTGLLGRYGAAKQAVAFDLDGDGTADVDPRGEEAFLVKDRRVEIAGATYDFTVAPDGSAVTLRPAPAGAPRPSLRVGAPAPAIAATDLAGAPVSLAALRGQVVVLDFWARWCTPCLAALPELGALAARERARGLAVVSIAVEDDAAALAAFTAARHMTWTQIAEPQGGPAQSAYRVVGIPEVYVVGRDGRLACSRCGPDELPAAVAAALASDAHGAPL